MMSLLSRRHGEQEDRSNEDGGSRNGVDASRGEDAKSSLAGRSRQSGGRGSLAKNKHIIEEFADVGVPHRVAYDQWTQYEEWSKIFKKESAKSGAGGHDRRRRSQGEDGNDDGGSGNKDRQVAVTAKIGPSKRQWQTEVVAQRPGRRIEWEAKGGIQAKGVVTFHRLDDRLTHLQVVIQYKPSGFVETIGNFLRMPRRRVRKDLRLFKNFVDLRGEATGEGPGRVRGGGLSEGVDEQLHEAEQSAQQSDQNSGDSRQSGDNKDGRDGERTSEPDRRGRGSQGRR
jgi:hypothetical protein